MGKCSTEKFYKEESFDDIVFCSPEITFTGIHIMRQRKKPSKIDLSSAKNVLDVGCGQGHLLQMIHKEFKNVECVGLDLNINDLKRAKQRCSYRRCGFVLADASCLPFENGCFDRVVCTAVLEHVVNEKKVLQEIWRVLNERGIAVLDVPGMYHLQNKLSDFFINRYKIFPFHREYSEKQVRFLLTITGFELQSFNSARFVGSLFLPIIETVYTYNRRKIVWCRGILAKMVCKIGDKLSSFCGNRRYLKLLGGSWFFKIKK